MHSPSRRELFAGARLDFPGIVDKMESVWEPIRESGVLVLRDRKAVDIQNAALATPRGLGTPVDSAVTVVVAFEAGAVLCRGKNQEVLCRRESPRQRLVSAPQRSQRRKHRQKGR